MGLVRICRYSEDYDLGVIRPGGPSLQSIWEGPKAEALRSAIAAGDLSHGCAACVPDVPGVRSDLAAEYDEFDPAASPWPQTMDLSLSSTCNLACTTCNGNLSSRIRREREHRPRLESPYDDAFFEQLAVFIPHVRSFTIHGGEPFLGRATKRVFQMIRDAGTEPSVVVSTNGTIFNDEVEDLVRSLRMRVTISIDGFTAATNERIRTGIVHADLLHNIEQFAAVAADMGQTLRYNFCLVPDNAHELADFLAWSAGEGVETRVIPVVDPPRFDVGLLPPDELRSAVEGMRADGRRVGERLGINAAAFEQAVRQLEGDLRSQSRTEPSETTVELRPGPGLDASPPPSRRRVHPAATPIAHRLTPIPAEAISVAVDDRGVIERVDRPSWASDLDTDAWIGHRHADVMGFLVVRYGSTPEVALVADPDGTQANQLTFQTERGRIVLASTPVAVDDGVAKTYHLQVLEAADGPEAVGAERA